MRGFCILTSLLVLKAVENNFLVVSRYFSSSWHLFLLFRQWQRKRVKKCTFSDSLKLVVSLNEYQILPFLVHFCHYLSKCVFLGIKPSTRPKNTFWLVFPSVCSFLHFSYKNLINAYSKKVFRMRITQKLVEIYNNCYMAWHYKIRIYIMTQLLFLHINWQTK